MWSGGYVADTGTPRGAGQAAFFGGTFVAT